MGFQDTKGVVKWNAHFSSLIKEVFAALTTDDGRKQFWAEETFEKTGSSNS